MKMKIISIAALLFILFAAIPLVHGAVDWTLPPNNLSSGYRVTTENFPDPIIIGDPVIAWAGTTNDQIVEVKFRWNAPEGSGLDPIVHIGTPAGSVEVEGKTVYQWTDTYTPTVKGDWGIQGVFYDGDGHGQGPIPEQPLKTAIRARSFFAVPEVAIGTVLAVIAMFGALGLFAVKKKRA